MESTSEFIVNPPDNYAVVAANVYRFSTPSKPHLSFLKRLNLCTLIHLSPESIPVSVTSFLQSENIRVIPLGMKYGWGRGKDWRVLPEEVIKEALEAVLDVTNHPIAICCTSGFFETGVVVGCLRRLQGWNFMSIVAEYRSFAGVKARFVNEQFIELFDTELITIPPNCPQGLLCAFDRSKISE